MILDTDQDFALSQGLTHLIGQIMDGVADLYSSLLSNTPPMVLLKDILDLTQEQLAALPKYLLGFSVLYLICGGITLSLHFTRGQKSLNSLVKQAVNMVLVIADFLFVPLLVVVWELARFVLGAVEPWSGETADLWRLFSQAWSVLFDPVLLFAILLFTALLPVQAAWRYLKAYRLAGVPHMIFDVGSGLYLACATMLSMLRENRLWYLLLLPAAVMLFLVQRGGYVPDARNTAAAHASDSGEPF